MFTNTAGYFLSDCRKAFTLLGLSRSIALARVEYLFSLSISSPNVNSLLQLYQVMNYSKRRKLRELLQGDCLPGPLLFAWPICRQHANPLNGAQVWEFSFRALLGWHSNLNCFWVGRMNHMQHLQVRSSGQSHFDTDKWVVKGRDCDNQPTRPN